MKRFNKEYFMRLWLLLVGLIIAHLGVTLFLLSQTGSDPFTTMVQGISNQLHLSVGTVHMSATAILIVIMAIFTRGYVKTGTFVCTLFGGPIIDVFTWLLGGFITPDLALWIQVCVAIAGCIILSAGMSLAIASNAGLGANDLVALILADKIKKIDFRWVRMFCDACFFIIGYLTGGIWGVGTVIAVLLIGPTVQHCNKFNNKIVENAVAKLKV